MPRTNPIPKMEKREPMGAGLNTRGWGRRYLASDLRPAEDRDGRGQGRRGRDGFGPAVDRASSAVRRRAGSLSMAHPQLLPIPPPSWRRRNRSCCGRGAGQSQCHERGKRIDPRGVGLARWPMVIPYFTGRRARNLRTDFDRRSSGFTLASRRTRRVSSRRMPEKADTQDEEPVSAKAYRTAPSRSQSFRRP
jgi:hypothetical protein